MRRVDIACCAGSVYASEEVIMLERVRVSARPQRPRGGARVVSGDDALVGAANVSTRCAYRLGEPERQEGSAG